MELIRAIRTSQTPQFVQTHTPSAHQLVDIYSHKVYKFCRSLTFSKEDADDLFQETYLAAIEKLPKAGDNAQGFLFSTALYIWKSWKRKHARRNRLAPTSPILPSDEKAAANIDIEKDFAGQEETRLVRDLVADLPEKYRIPTNLYYTAELSMTDIAAAMKLPVGTVKSRLHKARKLIEEGLVKNGYE